MAEPISNIYQFKITLKGPNVWRRIQVPEKYTFYDLHVAIQDVMGWEDYHLHKFEMNPTKSRSFLSREVLIGIPDKAMFPGIIPEKTAKIMEYFLSTNDKACYEYDFGIGWDHDIILEKILPATAGMKYPQCIDGRKPNPPEDGVRHGNSPPKPFDPKLVKFDDPEERWKAAFQSF